MGEKAVITKSPSQKRVQEIYKSSFFAALFFSENDTSKSEQVLPSYTICFLHRKINKRN